MILAGAIAAGAGFLTGWVSALACVSRRIKKMEGE